jgi:CSLREA domain-containing protein
VALSGTTAIVGAFTDDTAGGADAGSAYVFTNNGGTWTQQQQLLASDGAASDNFGNSVALSGDTAVVGASRDDTAGGADAGSAYVFTRSGSTWSQQQQLLAGDGASGDGFGQATAVDGDTAVVGAYLDDTAGGTNAGSAYVFTRSGSTWSQQQQLLAPDGAANDVFGVAVALSGDTALVGAELHGTALGADSGSAYVFIRSGSTWTVQQQLFPVVGAGQGILLDNPAFDNFGSSVALDGDTAIVGAWHDSTPSGEQSGSASVFTRSNVSWSRLQLLAAPDGADRDFFGTAVAVSGDTYLVGAPGHDVGVAVDAGSAYVFTPQPEIVVEQPAGTGLVDGGTVAYGIVPVGSSVNKTFTIKNIGTSDLTIADVHSDSGYFAVITGNMSSPVAPGGSTTFIVQFTAYSAGARTTDVHISSNDADENPFDITLTADTPQSGPNFVVNKTTDTDDGACSFDDCTLREAVNAANSNADTSAITFDATVFNTAKTIALTSGLALNQNVSITGPTAGVTIDGVNSSFNIFTVLNNASADFSILTITNGLAAISNEAGVVSVTASTLNSSGSGVNNAGTATLTNSTLSGNGYGFYNTNTATITFSTLSGNQNGFYNGNTATLTNTIVAGNTTTDMSGTAPTTASNNVLNLSAADAGLDPAGLKNNGGPTQTIALATGSPALDQGKAVGGVTTDQRGVLPAPVRVTVAPTMAVPLESMTRPVMVWPLRAVKFCPLLLAPAIVTLR